MNVDLTLEQWDKKRQEENKDYKNRIKLVKLARDIIARLGDDFSYQYIYNNQLRLSGYGETGEQAKELAAHARLVLGVHTSSKRLNSSSGAVEYTTIGENIQVVVTGGNIPDNCKLIPKANSYITYKMVCPGQEE
jgi:hypothetical protein